MSSWPDLVLLLTTRCLYQGGVHLIKICLLNSALENWTGNVSRLIFLFVMLLCNYVVVVPLSLCIDNDRWTTRQLHNSNNKINKKIIVHKLFNLFVLTILLVLCNFVFVAFVHLSLCIHNYRYNNNNHNNNKTINLHKFLNVQ